MKKLKYYIALLLLVALWPLHADAVDYAQFLPQSVQRAQTPEWRENFGVELKARAAGSLFALNSFRLVRASLEGQDFPESPRDAALMFFHAVKRADEKLKRGTSPLFIKSATRDEWKSTLGTKDFSSDKAEKTAKADDSPSIKKFKTKEIKAAKAISKAKKAKIKIKKKAKKAKVKTKEKTK